MRLLTRGRLSTLIIVVVFVAINVIALRWSTGFFRSNHKTTLLRYGSYITRLEGERLLGKSSVVPSTNRSNLVLYFSSTEAPGLSVELIRYAEILSQRYGKQGLGVTAIVPAEVPELRTLIEHSLIHYDIIADGKRQIGEKLGLAPDENGVFIFDQQGVCQFSTRRPVSAGDLRQLVANQFLHVDPFENPTTGRAIQKGKPLGSWSLLDVRSWGLTSLDKIRSGKSKRFVFFTAECSVCSLPAYLEEFAKFERREQTNGDPGKTTVLVFDFNFSPAELLEQLQIKNIKAPAYIANEELSAVVDIAQTRALNDEPVIRVETDEQGTVLDISSLKSLITAGTGTPVTASKPQAVGPNKTGPIYERVFHDIPLSAYDVAVYQSKYLFTDVKRNRVLIVKDNMEVEREFGRIGSGPGQLLHPGYIDVARDGTIYVHDGGNERIVKFTSTGDYLGEFPVTEYEGMAVGAENEIFLGQPEEDRLITVYSSSGKKLRSFGQLKKFSEIYGAALADKDDLYKIALNQVRLSTDMDGNLYVSFMLIPLIQKYSPQGKLLFEHKLEAPEIDQLMEKIQKRKYITANRNGADGRIIALDPVIQPATGNILVPLVDGSIYMADRDGNKVALLHPQWPEQATQTFFPFIAGLGAQGELLLTPFPPRRWYRLVTTTSSAENTTATAAGNERRAVTR